MQDWRFWAPALLLTLIVAAVLIRALRRGGQAETAPAPREADLAVYRDQLAEIARDLARGTIDPDEAQRLRAEIGRRVLEVDRAGQKAAPDTAQGKSGRILALIVVALILPGAWAAYWSLGAPGYADLALGPRLAFLDEAMRTRPAQEAELEQLGQPRDAALDERLAAELAAISDPAALRDRFAAQLASGDYQSAVRTGERLLTLLGEDAEASDHANQALALVIEAEGYVSPEAEAELRVALTRDMSNELARYLVGEMFLQGGRFDQAFKFWRPIAEEGDPSHPWVPSIRDRIEEVAGLAGIRYSLPEGTLPGPSAEDMAAAQDMSAEDRQAMIEGMVAQLSDRLATEGGSVEEWGRLIRALVVLERKDEAQKIYDEAKTVFAGQDAELSFLKLAAAESGLTQ